MVKFLNHGTLCYLNSAAPRALQPCIATTARDLVKRLGTNPDSTTRHIAATPNSFHCLYRPPYSREAVPMLIAVLRSSVPMLKRPAFRLPPDFISSPRLSFLRCLFLSTSSGNPSPLHNPFELTNLPPFAELTSLPLTMSSKDLILAAARSRAAVVSPNSLPTCPCCFCSACTIFLT